MDLLFFPASEPVNKEVRAQGNKTVFSFLVVDAMVDSDAQLGIAKQEESVQVIIQQNILAVFSNLKLNIFLIQEVVI